MGAGMEVYNDFDGIHWRANFNEAGDYEEWVNNEDVADLLEDIYQVKEKLKALTETKMQARNMELGWATLGDAHAKNLYAMFMKDMGVKNCEELKMKLMGMMMKVEREMRNCPIAKELE